MNEQTLKKLQQIHTRLCEVGRDVEDLYPMDEVIDREVLDAIVALGTAKQYIEAARLKVLLTITQ